MLDVAAILLATEPATTRAEEMQRREMRHGLHRLLRSYDERVCWPTTRPERIRFRNAVLELLRAYEDLHGLEHLIPPRVAERPRTKRNEAA